jgi:hypothetical protein
MARMTCPICRGETDPRKRLLESLCVAHYAELKPIDEATVRRVLDEGHRAWMAAMAARPTRRGCYRA